MTHLERFLTVARFETPDYIPIFGFPGAPGMSRGCMKFTHDRLVATGMPEHVGGTYLNYRSSDVDSWYRFWGTTGPIGIDFGLAWGAEGFKTTRRVEDGFETIESESGEVTRQVIDNDITYTMPEFIRYPVRDRDSWEFYRERTAPKEFMSPEDMEERCKKFDDRDMPLCIGAGGAYSLVRGLMGPEAASFAFHDTPELVHDMIQWRLENVRRTVFPLIDRLKPEIVTMGEDLCYNHGMMLSPDHFREFCGSYYQEVCDCARASDVPVVAVDTDGNAMEFTGLAASYGVNAIYPYEVKAGNDLFTLRQQHPRFLLFGWLEKETVNESNEDDIAPEIMKKVPPLLESRGYYPNGDHGIQPPVTYPNLCRFMTILHEVCDNPEGEFPRSR
jgi:hypothetical protein